MFVAQESELPVFEQFGECVLRRDLVHAAYSEEQLDLEHSYPLEDDVIRYMNRYALDIISSRGGLRVTRVSDRRYG